MTATQMLNFRVKDAELRAIDAAAKAAGMNRSDFIRFALNSVLKNEVAVTVKPKPAPQTKTKCAQGQDPRTCVSAVWVKLPTGVRQCQVCGVRKG